MPYPCAVARPDGSRVDPDDDDALRYLVVMRDAVCGDTLLKLHSLVKSALEDLGADEVLPVDCAIDGVKLIMDSMISIGRRATHGRQSQRHSWQTADPWKIAEVARPLLSDEQAELTDDLLALLWVVRCAIYNHCMHAGYLWEWYDMPFGDIVVHLVLYRSDYHGYQPNIVSFTDDDLPTTPAQPTAFLPWLDFVCIIGNFISDQHIEWDCLGMKCISRYVDDEEAQRARWGRPTADGISRTDEPVIADRQIARALLDAVQREVADRWADRSSNLLDCVNIRAFFSHVRPGYGQRKPKVPGRYRWARPTRGRGLVAEHDTNILTHFSHGL